MGGARVSGKGWRVMVIWPHLGQRRTSSPVSSRSKDCQSSLVSVDGSGVLPWTSDSALAGPSSLAAICQRSLALPVASKPKCRIFTKRGGSTWATKRRRNSTARGSRCSRRGCAAALLSSAPPLPHASLRSRTTSPPCVQRCEERPTEPVPWTQGATGAHRARSTPGRTWSTSTGEDGTSLRDPRTRPSTLAKMASRWSRASCQRPVRSLMKTAETRGALVGPGVRTVCIQEYPMG
jgi:hypothetical protein